MLTIQPYGSADDRLTPRERQVCKLAVRRNTDAQIARELNISVRTVHAHLRSAYIKLGIRTRRDLPPPNEL
ncbi:MAG: helix-turn-helix transcriptional regulator [Acidimicrobiia bacterium]